MQDPEARGLRKGRQGKKRRNVGGASYVSLEGLLAIGNMLFLCWLLGLGGIQQIDRLVTDAFGPRGSIWVVDGICWATTFPLGLLLTGSTGSPTVAWIVTAGVLLGVNSVFWGEGFAFVIRFLRAGDVTYAKREMFRPTLIRIRRQSVDDFHLRRPVR